MCPKLTSEELKNHWADGYEYHTSSIGESLLNFGLFVRKGAKKPLST